MNSNLMPRKGDVHCVIFDSGQTQCQPGEPVLSFLPVDLNDFPRVQHHDVVTRPVALALGGDLEGLSLTTLVGEPLR